MQRERAKRLRLAKKRIAEGDTSIRIVIEPRTKTEMIIKTSFPNRRIIRRGQAVFGADLRREIELKNEK